MKAENSPVSGRRRAILKWSLLLVVAARAAVIDLWTKRLAEERLALGDTVEVVSFLSLQRTANSGVAFGLLGGRLWLILLANAVAIGVVLFYVHMERRWILAGIGGGLIIGGTIGNIVQRVSGDGHVTDFLKFPYWPNYNMADVFIFIGIAIIFVGLIVEAVRVARTGRETPASH